MLHRTDNSRPSFTSLANGTTTNTKNSVCFYPGSENTMLTDIGTFLINNFKQVQQNVANLSHQLAEAKAALAIEHDDVFDSWIAEEKMYLASTERLDDTDVLRMEYV